ncbi:Undecaprenyl phosphate-alpha-4-amino-4-deoxy-L-arabinose arabinosyl transferase [bacterium HR30]|nr:Undecaprenyl phosphate-alpha-4-amino-4-deoxy-L-arabinose arabinosyl transferase [bacterium HR30]
MTSESAGSGESREHLVATPEPSIRPADSGWPIRRWVELGLALVIVTAMWWPLTWWRLGAAPFHTKGEPREALVVWEMTHGGGWILPRRNGTEIPSKPPMFHWLGALASWVSGRTDEGTVRMPSALASLLGLYGVVLAGSAWWSVRAGMFSAFVLATSFEWTRAATNARVDMVLTLGLEASLLALLFFWRSRKVVWLAVLYPAMAWAVLAKGPVGVALPALVTIGLLATTWNANAFHTGHWREVVDWPALRELRPLRGLAFVAAVAGAWYVAALYEGGWAFFRKQILAENIFTFVHDPDWGGGHRHGLLYLPVQWFLGSLPWSLLWPVVALDVWRRRRMLGRSDPLVGLMIWIAVVFLFYEFAASKRGVYLLALYPAVALFCGWWWSELSDLEPSWGERWRTVLAYGAHAFSAVLAAALAGLGAVKLGLSLGWIELSGGASEAWRLLLGVAQRAVSGATLISGVGCIVLWWWTGRALQEQKWRRSLLLVFFATWTVAVTVRSWWLPAFAQQVTLRDFMAAVRAASGSEPVYFWGIFDYQAVYYFYGHIPLLGADGLESAPAFLLVDREAWVNPASKLRTLYEEVPLNLAHGEARRRLVLLRRKAS